MPAEIKTLPREDTATAQSTLRRLARSKPAWYAVVILAMAGASVVAVRRFMANAHLRGMGEATINALRRYGKMLGTSSIAGPTVKATKSAATYPIAFPIPTLRRAYLKERGNALVHRVMQGDMSGLSAFRAYAKEFTLADNKDMVRNLLTAFSNKVNGK